MRYNTPCFSGSCRKLHIVTVGRVPLAATVFVNCGPRPAKRAPARAVVQHSAPSHPPAARGRPNAAQRRFTAALRTLVAALTGSHRPPARAELTNAHRDTSVASRSRRALVRRGNRRATAGEREFGALTPVRTLLPTPSGRRRYVKLRAGERSVR